MQKGKRSSFSDFLQVMAELLLPASERNAVLAEEKDESESVAVDIENSDSVNEKEQVDLAQSDDKTMKSV